MNDDRDKRPRSKDAPRPGRRERGGGANNGSGKPAFGGSGKPRFGGPGKPKAEGRPFGASGKSAGKPRHGARTVGPSVEEGERIAKRLARAGIASRRDAEALIAAGRIKVNGEILTSPARNVLNDDRIELDGTEIPPIERTRLFLFHKPAGVVTTSRDPEGRRTVFDVLPDGLPRLVTVGRLDINTEGLLLLTNDGGLARMLELPATGWLRRYRVRVHGSPDEAALAGLKDGIAVGGVFYGAIEASLDRAQGSNAWLTIGLREGKNREVKNVLASLGLAVTRLIRISYGPFQLGELPEGHVWEMKGKTLRDQLGERLIEEAGANFEAEIATPFSNKPTRREPDRPQPMPAAAVRPALSIGAGGLVKNRKRDREAMRDEALGRLSTSRPPRSGGKPDRQGKDGGRMERRDEPLRPRLTNVWMAPGARPQGKTKAEAPAGKSAAAGKGASKPHAGRPGGGKPHGAKPHAGKSGEKRSGGPTSAGRPAGPRKGRPDADRRR